MSTVVVALGGNAILESTRMGTWQEQSVHVAAACDMIVDLLKAGHRVAVTHGNGPQVGSILLQNEAAGHYGMLRCGDTPRPGSIGMLHLPSGPKTMLFSAPLCPPW